MKNKRIIILRGAAGAGKSSFADIISDPKVICCADDYFMQDGEYLFDPDKLGLAHAYCRDKFDQALLDPDVENIVVANTNCKPNEWSHYERMGLDAGARVFFVVMENRHCGVNQHNVPNEVIERHKNTIKNNIKL